MHRQDPCASRIVMLKHVQLVSSDRHDGKKPHLEEHSLGLQQQQQQREHQLHVTISMPDMTFMALSQGHIRSEWPHQYITFHETFIESHQIRVASLKHDVS